MYSNSLIISLITFLNNNYLQEISIKDLALKFNYNEAYLMRLFKKELGLTIFEYLNKKKIYYALSLFSQEATFLSIAFKSGFKSEEYFSETFKKIIGVNPRDYKNFLNRKKAIDKKKKEHIILKIIELEELNEKITNYSHNNKPLLLVKVKKII